MGQTYRKTVFFAFIITSFAACQLVELEEPGPGETDSEAQLITGPTTVPADEATFLEYLHNGTDGMRTWSAKGFTLFGLRGFQSCRLDDEVSINADGTYTYDGGVELCGTEDNERTKSGTWELGENNTIIFDPGTDQAYEAKVTGLDQGEIVLSGTYLGLEIRGQYQVAQ